MRKYVILAIAALVVVVGGVIGARSWLESRAMRAEVERKVAAARELMSTEAGWSNAAVELDAALQLAPDDVPALVARGEVAMRLKQLNDAIRHLDRAEQLSRGSEHAAIQIARGRAYGLRYDGTRKEEDFRSARNAFQDARVDPVHEAEAMIEYGLLFLSTQRVTDAEKGIAILEELLKKHPDCPEAARIRDLLNGLGIAKSASSGG